MVQQTPEGRSRFGDDAHFIKRLRAIGEDAEGEMQEQEKA